MKVRIYVEFPCGYKMGCRASSMFASHINLDFDFDDMPLCPLHKKDCRTGGIFG